MLYYVNKYGAINDPQSVLNAMDRAAETSWMMNIGPEKGQIIEDLVERSKPKEVLELGTFCGYSTIRMAKCLGPDSRITTVEKDKNTFEVASQVMSKAGLLNSSPSQFATVNMILGDSSDEIKKLPRGRPYDFVLMDHWKEFYHLDLALLAERGLLHPGYE